MRSIIEQYSKDLTAGRLSFGYDHLCRVYFYAKKIGENYDDQILHAASFLYKIILGQTSKEDSALRAESILAEVGYPIEKVSIIKNIILNTDSNDSPESLEGKLIHDAIIIDSLGAIGFARYSVGSFFWHKAQRVQTIFDEYSSYYEEAKSRLMLQESRDFADSRIKTSEYILNELKKELEEE